MDLQALRRVFARAPGAEPEAPAPISNHEAREERAAIMEFDGDLSRADAEAEAARLHPDPNGAPSAPDAPPPLAEPPAPTAPAAIDQHGPWYGYTRADLAAIEPDLWSEIHDRPEVLQAFARALSEDPNAPRPGRSTGSRRSRSAGTSSRPDAPDAELD